MTDVKKVGWIGVGMMGSRMSKRLMDAGYALYVCDVAQEKVDRMVAQGARAVSSPGELMKHVDVAFSMVPNGKILLDIISGENGILSGMAPGKVLIDTSTVEPRVSAQAAALLEGAGGQLLRSCVTGSVAYAEAGELGLMVSGSRAVYEACLPMLKIIGNRQTYLGEHEEGRYMKVVINMFMGSLLQGFSECVVFGEKVGLDWETMLDLIGDSAAAPPVVRYKVEALKKRDFTPMSFATTMRKDLAIAMDVAREKDICIPSTAIAHEYYSGMLAQGMGGLDLSGLIITNERMNGIDRS